ncbi:histidine kinase N-terminal 7TM domain-containing diguanylate cyclase [Alkalicoccus daliensis]|uniref:Diguanylate cyclase (GGDEF) domain-containing protein n=1 Tax=Alkalicoccus daliensis TaxID=745820 RepID=A0A1H0FTR2_9BACI|nr:diguanylate cyclase [Alkalicoccus daliensis]SDN98058.1 diguanylate cyclase (GGDEF) domain-containing protein [Alkalicoccus daliensis]
MDLKLTAYITLICTSGVFNLFLGTYVLLKRHYFTKIANFFVLYTFLITIYCFAAAFGLMATTLEEIKFWTTVQYIGLAFSPPAGLLFIRYYLGKRITKRGTAALMSFSAVTLLLVATNDVHHFHYRVFDVHPSMGLPYITQEIGIWYMIYGTFIFSCMFAAFLMLVSRWKETEKTYRPQLIALMISQLVPMCTAFVYLIGATPPGIDPVPTVLWISSALLLWSTTASRLFTIMPIAKESIFHSIHDGVIVLDSRNQIIEFNQASSRMFNFLKRSLLGRDFSSVWIEACGEPFPAAMTDTSCTQEFEFSEFPKKVYQIRTSPLMQGSAKKGMLLIFSDFTELKQLQWKLEHQAYYDELTNVYNRRAFFQHSEKMFIEAQKNAVPFTVILTDIDFFKSVNDTYGHDTGDEVLKHVVNSCQEQLSEDILFARYGGEEFVVAVSGKTLLEVEALANQLRENLACQPVSFPTGPITVTLSSGVAAVTAEDKTLSQLLIKADKALYQAKEAGRNKVHVYTALQAESSI